MFKASTYKSADGAVAKTQLEALLKIKDLIAKKEELAEFIYIYAPNQYVDRTVIEDALTQIRKQLASEPADAELQFRMDM